jgi:isochorismate hydrolase
LGIGAALRPANNACRRTWWWAPLFELVQAKAFVRFVGWFSHQAANASRWAAKHNHDRKGKIMKQHTQQKAMALLVIDVQKELFEKSTPIYRAQQLLENINTLIDKARQEDVLVVFIQHSSNKILKKGSAGWQFRPEIQPLAEEVIIHKLHGNAFEETNLREELEKRNVSVVVVTGLVTHGCVKATCLGAMEEG